jgi:CO/xanthine dehydrogenase Mo-binding subunit
MTEETRVVGHDVPRVDAVEKVQGKAVYAVDLILPHMLFGTFVRSPHAWAKIKSVDTSKARQVPGVRVVVTGADFPYTFGSTIKDRPFLAQDQVRFVGEPVAAVAASTLEAAREACSLIHVEYEPMAPILDPEEAMKPSAPLIHEKLGQYKASEAAKPMPGTNICSHYKLRKGDVEKAFAESDTVYEGVYKTQMVQHVCLEPHAAVAQWQAGSRRLTVWVGTVSPFMSRKELADGLGIPMSNIRVVVPRVGGSFGSKMYLKAEVLAVALAWFADGRPVKVVFDREDEFNLCVKGPTITRIKTGVMKDGSITAREVESIWDTGGYADSGPRVTRNSGHTSPGPYRIPAVKIDGYTIYTNKNISVPFRGYGTQELCWAYETHTDELANKLGMDPMEFRQKNAVRPGDETATGQPIDCLGLIECLDKIKIAAKWEQSKNGKLKSLTPGKVRGQGVACIHKASGAPSTSSAIIKFNEDGTVVLLASTVEQGQGSETILTQMVAEELGIRVQDVFISAPDTDYTPFDSSSTSSRSTYHMGNAIRMACKDAKEQLVEAAAKSLKVAVDEVELLAGIIRVKAQPERNMALKDVVLAYFGYRGGTIIGRGVYRPNCISPDKETGLTTKMSPFWMYGVQTAEVEVDLATGQVEIVGMKAFHDVGRAINPVTVKQQLEGALMMGIGGATTEDVVLSDKGATLNANLHDYKIPTALDTLDTEIGIVESIQEDGPFGSKGVGEPALGPTAPAIGNAVYAACGVRITDLPITAEKVLAGLKKQQS